MMFRCLPLLVLLFCIESAAGQNLPGDAEINRRAQRILDNPEFNYLIDPNAPKRTRRPQRFTDGTGRGSGNGAGRGNNNGGDANPGNGGRNNPEQGNPNGGREIVVPRDGRKSRDRNRGSDPVERDLTTRKESTPTERNSGAAAIGGFFQVLAWIILIVICVVVLVVIIQGILNARRDLDLSNQTEFPGNEGGEESATEPDIAPGDLPPDEYINAAEELAAAGDFRAAIGTLVVGAMGHLERAGVIQYRRGLTARDYLRKARGHEQFFAPMRALVRIYEPLGFGRRSSSAQGYQRALAAYRSGFLGAPRMA